MTEEELAQIEARAAAATPGPWERSGDGWGDPIIVTHSIPLDSRHMVMREDHIGAEEDAVFIASAREDVPALVAEVRRLKRKLEVSVHAAYDLEEGWDDCIVDVLERNPWVEKRTMPTGDEKPSPR